MYPLTCPSESLCSSVRWSSALPHHGPHVHMQPCQVSHSLTQAQAHTLFNESSILEPSGFKFKFALP